MNKIIMIQSEEKSYFKLSQIEERSQKASRYETISDKTETISTRPRPDPRDQDRDRDTRSQSSVSRPNIPVDGVDDVQ